MSDYWRRTMEWLGLVGQEDHHDPGAAHAPAAERSREPQSAHRPARESRSNRGAASVSYLRTPVSEDEPQDESPAGTGKLRRLQKSDPAERVIHSVSAPLSQMYVVEPRSINDAQRIVDRLRGGEPVIMNLQSTPTALAQRLADFVNGAAYGLGGGAQPVADRVILVTPSSVEVSDEDRRRLREKSLFFTLARKQGGAAAGTDSGSSYSSGRSQGGAELDERGEHLSDDISSWRQREQRYLT